MKWKIIFVTLLMSTNLLLSGCVGSKEINTLAIAISVGIDKIGDEYSVTYQVLNPKAIASQKASDESPFFLFTERGKDLFEIIRRVTTISPRKIYNSHIRMVVFSEEIAKEGIQDLLDFFLRDHEYRTDFYFVVSKGATAYEILKTITPLEDVSGIEMYNSIQSSKKAWTPTKAVKIIELVNKLISDGIDPVLSSVEIVRDENQSDSLEGLRKSTVSKLKLSGLCAFNGDKLVGYLNENESEGFNYITGHVKDTVGYVQIDKSNRITYEVIKAKSKPKAYLLKGKSAINVKIDLIVNIAAETGDFDASTENNAEKISKLVEKEIVKLCKSSIKKAQEDLGTDIFGFGEVIHRENPKLWKKIKDDWNSEFKKLPVNVTVHTKVNRLGETTKSFFSKEK